MGKKNINLSKKEIVKEVNSYLKERPYFIFASYSKLKAFNFTLFRRNLKAKNAVVKIYKNNLFKIVLSDLINNNPHLLNQMKSKLVGPLVYIFSSQNEIINISKLLVSLNKEKVIELKGGFLENSYYTLEKINVLSTIPPREILLVKLLNQFQLPLRNFLNVLNGNLKKLFFVLNQIKEKK